MSFNLGFVLDLMVIALLGTMIAYAAVLNRRLAAWREGKADLERLVAEFNRAAERAEAGIERLKTASEETGKTLQQALTKGQGLRDDLSYLLERAEPLADRLTGVVRMGRSAAAADPVARSQDSSTAAATREQAGATRSSDREQTKRELLRALAAMR
ncbi:MAG TPA: DUF6468 domain-containing protein [Alphaproteobacteria bacterium]